MIRLIAKFFIAISSNQKTGQVALSLVLGMILGLTPLLMPHNLLILLVVILLRVNLSAVLVSWLVFTGMSYLVDPLSHQVGLWVLQHPELQGLFTEWYNTAFWRFVAFNQTVVMGSIVIAFGASIPLFFIFSVLIRLYRVRFLKWINRFKVVKFLKAAMGVKSVMGVVG